jgi:hypothetical protein
MVMQAAAPSLEVYLPWAAYNRQIIPRAARVIVYDPYVHKTWTESVQLYHPPPPALHLRCRLGPPAALASWRAARVWLPCPDPAAAVARPKEYGLRGL